MPKFKPGDRVRFISSSSPNACYFQPQLNNLVIGGVDPDFHTNLGKWYLIHSPIVDGYYAAEAELTLESTHIHTKANTCLKLNAITT